jgi:FHS family L-fucose permease-like MFS transporter
MTIRFSFLLGTNMLKNFLKIFNQRKPMKSYKQPLIFVMILFFLFGFITCLNDILIPHLKSLFTLNFTQAMLVQVCFFSAYFVMSIPSGRITVKKGYRFGIVAGLGIAALGTLGFIPAAQLGSYTIFLISLFVLASGITLLQVAINPYVTLLGPPEKSAFRLNLVQAFNSLGTTLAPLLGSLLILESVDKVRGIQVPYFVLTVTLILVAVILSRVPLPSLSDFSNQEIPDAVESFGDSLRHYMATMKNHPHLILGMLAIFFYVGAEVSVGSFLVSWLGDPQVAGFSHEEAGRYVSFYWGGAMVGRFLGSYLTAKFKPAHVLICSLVSILILISVAVIAYTPGLSMWAIILIGLFNSVLFPTIFSISVAGLGKDTPYASGLLCTCIVGGALIPLLQAVAADSLSLRVSYIIPFICYLYILAVSNRLMKKE